MRHKFRKLATINSSKHIFNHSIATVATGAIQNIVEAVAVVVASVDAVNEVREGSVIKAIYIELWVLGVGSAEPASFIVTVEKAKGGQPDMTFVQSNNLGAYPNKGNVLYTTQGIVGDDTNNAVPFIRQWIAIPKGKQRMALGDELRVNTASITTGVQVCGVTIYKEYF